MPAQSNTPARSYPIHEDVIGRDTIRLNEVKPGPIHQDVASRDLTTGDEVERDKNFYCRKFSHNQTQFSASVFPAQSDSKNRLTVSPLSTFSSEQSHDFKDDTTLLSESGTLLNLSSYACSDTSMATTTTADSAFQQGLAELDANIAKLEKSLQNAN